ncbi:MAG: hypothetical protein ACRD2A_12335 [Vicinamibacterales bacterium]
MRSTFRAVLAISLLLSTACDKNSSPTSPSTTAQLAGTWSYNARLNSASGGECVGADFQAVIGATDSGTLTITQSGTSLTATQTSDVAGGGSCTYTGSVSSSSFTLNLTRCDGGQVLRDFPCSNGARRDIEFATNPIDGTVTGTSMTATSVETYNIYTAGTTTRVGTLTLTASITAMKR